MGKAEKRLVASLAATSLRLGQRLHLQSVIFGHFYWIKRPELSPGGGVDTRRPFLSDLYCCSITESTGHAVNLHLREFSSSRCGMKKPNKSVNSH